VYWVTDALFAPAAKDLFGFGSSTNYLLAGYAGYRRVVWGRNSDPAGSGIATQAMFFVSPPPGNGSLPSRGVGVGVRGGRAANGTLAPFAVEHYYQALTPAVKLLVTDLYGQVNTSDSTTVVTVTVVPEHTAPPDTTTTVSGLYTVKYDDGNTHYYQAIAYLEVVSTAFGLSTPVPAVVSNKAPTYRCQRQRQLQSATQPDCRGTHCPRSHETCAFHFDHDPQGQGHSG
jgi:hypothetical protein